ncbi:MAG TPA: isocitrate/isopropylmalate family dehydrogenase, partial [Gaiellaceae bacterium]|nr:isocitrate/isopropylmalate family dehydrogenase [Gaiellaceae bacterium]
MPTASRPATPHVVILPGDGIGPEVAREARLALELVAPDVSLEEQLLGGAAIRATGNPLPDETLEACRRATA